MSLLRRRCRAPRLPWARLAFTGDPRAPTSHTVLEPHHPERSEEIVFHAGCLLAQCFGELHNQHVLRGFCADQAEISAAFGIGERERQEFDAVLEYMTDIRNQRTGPISRDLHKT